MKNSSYSEKLKIPVEHIYASIALSGGQAYTEDVLWILQELFGQASLEEDELEARLRALPNVKSKFDLKSKREYWKLEDAYFVHIRKEIEPFMRICFKVGEPIEPLMRKALKYKPKN